jgi:NADPH:quinone reductase-like Zn-dependent oxidoreductase
MRAAVYERYGPPEVVHVQEVAKPTPKDNEVLIRIRATTVTSGDWRARTLTMPPGFGFLARLVFGISGPRQPILGSEFAGEIEAVGKGVTNYKPGDQVFAFAGARMGSHAEYRTMPADGLIARKPANITYDEAAALSFGGTTALNFFRRGNLKSGETMLVNGASGAVGTAVVQLAKHFGATVTGVTSTANLDLVKSIGADTVIDYTKQDFAKNGEKYDVIVDTAGTAPFSRSAGSLTEKGRLLHVLGGFADTVRAPFVSMTGSKKAVAGPASVKPDDMRVLAEIAAAGEFKPVIDRRYPLEEIAAAHAYVDQGHKRGNVVVTVGKPICD